MADQIELDVCVLAYTLDAMGRVGGADGKWQRSEGILMMRMFPPRLMEEAKLTGPGGSYTERYEEALEQARGRLSKELDEAERAALIRRLVAMALADGELHEAEAETILAIGLELGFEAERSGEILRSVVEVARQEMEITIRTESPPVATGLSFVTASRHLAEGGGWADHQAGFAEAVATWSEETGREVILRWWALDGLDPETGEDAELFVLVFQADFETEEEQAPLYAACEASSLPWQIEGVEEIPDNAEPLLLGRDGEALQVWRNIDGAPRLVIPLYGEEGLVRAVATKAEALEHDLLVTEHHALLED